MLKWYKDFDGEYSLRSVVDGDGVVHARNTRDTSTNITCRYNRSSL